VYGRYVLVVGVVAVLLQPQLAQVEAAQEDILLAGLLLQTK
jgi:hypothetical protein